MHLKQISLLIAIFFCYFYNAQTIIPKHSFSVNLALPNAVGNDPFSTIMQGLINFEPSYQFAFKNGLAMGAGLKYTFFDIDEFRSPEPAYGGMHTGGAYFKIGHEKFHTQRFGTDLGMKFGYTYNFFGSDLNDAVDNNPQLVEAVYIEPTVRLFLSANDQSAYSLVFSYAIQGFGFYPARIGITEDGGFDPEDFNKPTQYITIGFAYTHYFNSRK